jgi:1-acyl-sn-glycerol-3-phosphate acyltransferase
MGLHNVPADGPLLFVSNHSGALPFDGAMICTALHMHDGRVARFLYDRFVANVGPVDTFYRRVGGVPAARENALELLKRGEQVVIFPGAGGRDLRRPARLRSFSRVRALSARPRVPVVPVAVVGRGDLSAGRPCRRGQEALQDALRPDHPFFPSWDFWGRCPFRQWF